MGRYKIIKRREVLEMSYKKPCYEQVDNDKSANYITPNVVLVMVIALVPIVSRGCQVNG